MEHRDTSGIKLLCYDQKNKQALLNLIEEYLNEVYDSVEEVEDIPEILLKINIRQFYPFAYKGQVIFEDTLIDRGILFCFDFKRVTPFRWYLQQATESEPYKIVIFLPIEKEQ